MKLTLGFYKREFVLMMGVLAMGAASNGPIKAQQSSPKRKKAKVNIPGGRKPVRIIEISHTNAVFTGQSIVTQLPGQPPTFMPHVYGSLATYKLQIRDNQNNPYGLGRAKEGFMNVNPTGFNPNPTQGKYTWPQGANIEDTNGWVVEYDPGYAANHLIYSFDQPWACLVGSKSKPKRYPLNMHSVTHYWHYTIRTGG